MERIDEKILVYNLLDEEGRREVDAYLEAHPDLAPLLDEAHAFEELLRQARRLQDESPDDEVLAYFLATRHVANGAGMPKALQETFARIEARLAKDAELQARYQRMEQRLRALEEASDARAQFERLTGLSLADVPPADPPPPPQRHAPDRPARVHRLHSRPLRWAVAAVLGAVVAYGLLFMTSHAMQSPLEQLAWLDDEALSVEGYEVTFRSDVQADEIPATDAALVDAIYLLREARSSFLGLFPHYDEARLAEAEERLRFAAGAGASPFVQAEARYLLGKVLLAQDRVDEAREVLQAVADAGRNKAAEAQDLLDRLEEVGTS